MDINNWIETIRTRLSAIDVRELANTAAGALRRVASDAVGTLEEWIRAAGSVNEPSLRLLAGVLALVALGTAVVLTVRMIRHRRRAPGLSRPKIAGASRSSWTECAARVDRLASLGAGQGEIARAIGVPRDALTILAPTVDWHRSKLPRSAGNAVQSAAAPRFQQGSHSFQVYAR